MASKNICDSFLHTKSDASDGSGVIEKVTLPITRWENIMGRPKRIKVSDLDSVNGGEYLFVDRKSISLPNKVYEACYPEFD